MTPRLGWLATKARRFAADECGATAIEYAILTFIAVALVVIIGQLGGTVTGLYEEVLAALQD